MGKSQIAGDRMGRPDWVRAALRSLAEGGIAAVRVEPLAKALGVTKGSFYWHFADHAALLAQLREAWETLATLDIIARVEEAGGTASDRLLRLMMMTLGTDGRLDLAVRAWAQADPATAAIVARVDERRLVYLEGLFALMGFDGVEGRVRARHVYHALLGAFMLGWGMDGDARDAAIRSIHALVTRPG